MGKIGLQFTLLSEETSKKFFHYKENNGKIGNKYLTSPVKNKFILGNWGLEVPLIITMADGCLFIVLNS